MKRRLISLPVAALVAALLAVPATASDAPHLTRGGHAKFPQRSFVLSLPKDTSVDPSRVRLTENGEPVHELNVVPARRATHGRFGTVLVIDASTSMRGRPIAQALAAARRFNAYRRPGQKLGVVVFNRSAATALDLTTDRKSIDRALSTQPRLAPQARIYDGVNVALSMLERERVDVGSVILLSDCAATCKDGRVGAPAAGGTAGSASRTNGGALIARARDRGVRVFTVGLRSQRNDASTLVELAVATGAEYSAASTPADLERLYGQLGSRIANEYSVEYTSSAGPGARVRVKATADGVPGSAVLTYSSPRLRIQGATHVKPRTDGFWSSTAALLLVSFGAAFLLCFAIVAAVSLRHRPETVDERVAAFVTMRASPAEFLERRRAESGLYAWLEARVSARDWWQSYRTAVDVGRIKQGPVQIAVATFFVTVFTMWLFASVSGQAWPMIFAISVPIGVRAFVRRKAQKQRALFADQLADNLQVLASAMRAGQSFSGALAVAVEEAPEPARREFQRVVSDEQLGVPVEESLRVVAKRMQNRDVEQVVLVASMQREAGGNSAEVLDRVADSIRDRVAVRRLIRTLTAQGRLGGWIVTLLPIAISMFIALANPDYLDPLRSTTAGNVLLVLAALMVLSGSLAIRKIVDIKV